MELLERRSLHDDDGLHPGDEQLERQPLPVGAVSRFAWAASSWCSSSTTSSPASFASAVCSISRRSRKTASRSISTRPQAEQRRRPRLPRPKVEYGLDPYTMEGSAWPPTSARRSTSGWGRRSSPRTESAAPRLHVKGKNYHYYGAGHVVGTHRMATIRRPSVVDASQRSHDIPNLWIVGSGSFRRRHRKPDADSDGAGVQNRRRASSPRSVPEEDHVHKQRVLFDRPWQ